MTKETIEIISAWVTIIGLPIAIITIFVAVRQFIHYKRIEEAKFWLDLRQKFLSHNEVHLKLRNGGQWTSNNAGPQTPEDWAKIDAYLGQFELCQSMLEKHLISNQTFKDQYDYRLDNITQNRAIVNKINQEIADWKQFIILCKNFGYGNW